MRIALMHRGLLAAAAVATLVGSGCGSDAITARQKGGIRVSVQISGGVANRAFALVVGSEVRRAIDTTETIILNAISPGTHPVSLEVAENCTVIGTPPNSVTVLAGQIVDVAFRVECATTGIQVAARTTGFDNGFGYKLLLNSVSAWTIPVNGQVELNRLPPGSYTVALSIPGAYCTVAEGQLTVQVSNRTLTLVVLDVACVPPARTEKIAFEVETIVAGELRSSIALMNPDGSGIVELASGHTPSWSPDGTRLAYTTVECSSYYGYGCTGNLVVADPETGKVDIVAEGKPASSPAWAPTGDVIAYVDRSSGSFGKLYLVGLHGTHPERLYIYPVVDAYDPAWSPDGKQIAFQCVVNPPNIDVCIVNRNGSGLAQLTHSNASQGRLAWSPGGTRIAFTATSMSQRQVGVMAADGSGVKTLTIGFDPTWSRDGTKLLFGRDEGLFIMNADGSNVNRLTNGHHYAPAWRP